MKRIGLPGTVNALYLRQTSRCTIERVYSVMRATARAVAADNALALRAATKAEASPRRSLAEVRAMYVPSSTTIGRATRSVYRRDAAPRQARMKE